MVGSRPKVGATEGNNNDQITIESLRERQARNRVQFNLGPPSAPPRSTPNKALFRPIPELLKTQLGRSGRFTENVPGQAAASPFSKPSRNSAPGASTMAATSQGSNSSISYSHNLRTDQNRQQDSSADPVIALGETSRRDGEDTIPETSITQLVPKPRVRGSSVHRRNLSKVAYTYQAVIRPSSPSYMASTSASRNRSSNSSNSSKLSSIIGSGSLKSGRIRASAHQRPLLQTVLGLSTTPSQSSTATGSILRGSLSNKTLGSKIRNARKNRKKSRFRISTPYPELGHHSSSVSVVLKEKFLMRIFSNLNWNELLAVRWTCKKWYEIISTEAPLKKEGVIILRRNLEGMTIFNKSLYVWTQFRIFVSVVFDFTDPMQQEFWSKHGKTMSYLEIRNSSMTLSALVEILSRCPNLEHFSVTWTAEMYSFNSEMIKKYYGIHFRNGTFVKLHELTIDKSYFLTDNALWSLLKWCGGSIHRLALTCGPDDHEDTLSRLKPRWSIEPIQNYTSRFGYSGNFKFLDFSGSNLNSEDLKTLAKTEKLNSLIGIRLSSCKITDESINFFVEKKGGNLEELYVDNTAITEKGFEGSTKLPRLKALNISGKKGNFHNLDFLPYLKSLEEFICSETHWLTYSTLARPIEGLGQKNNVKKLDISMSNNIISRVDQRMNKIWFNHLTTILPRLTELNLNYCGSFGNDDNFKAICTNVPSMEKLSVREWTSLTDEALVGMTFDDIIKQYDDVRGFWKDTDTALKISPVICNLKYLRYLDLGGCKKLTDICVQFAIIHLPRLAKLGLDKSQVTDASYQLLVSKSPRLEKLCLLGCEHRFTNEDHLQVHKKRHEMSLNLSKSGLNLGNVADGFVDETPTPTRFIRNCEEVGLFQDLQNVNPFDEQFTKATSATPSTENFEFNFCITTKKLPDDTLNTPQVFGYPASASIPEPVVIPPITSSTIQNPGVSTTSSEISESDNGQDFSQNSKTSEEPMIVGCTAEDTKVESTTPDNESFVPPVFSVSYKIPSKLKLNFTGTIESSESEELQSDSPSVMSGQKFPMGEGDEGDEGMVYTSGDAHTDTSKSSKKPRNAVDLDGKKAELLERNRAAASRSRERRKQWVSGLEVRCQNLQSMLSQAQAEVAKLKVENNYLREELNKHANCDVTRAEPRQRVTTPRTPEFQPQILKHSSSASHIIRNATGTSVVTATTYTTASASNSFRPPVVPAVHVKPKRGRPRKGFEKRVEGIVIPSSVALTSTTKVPLVTPVSSESGVPVKVEILPVKSVDGQQLTNLYIVKQGT